MPRVNWLDKYIGQVIQGVYDENSRSQELALFVSFPDFLYPVVFYQKVCTSIV